MNRRTIPAAVLAAALAVTLAACGSSTTDSGSSSTTSASPTASAAAITAAAPGVKAVDSGMTAAFVVLTNTTGAEQTLVKAETSASPMVELHEMAMIDGEMKMQQKDGGIPIPADGEATLEPGGDHIMLMGVTAPIKPGDVVPITLTFASGETLEIDAVAKEFEGGEEPYHSDGSMESDSNSSDGHSHSH
jgi:copper(I)-binding protein